MLNELLSQSQPGYAANLGRYTRVVEQRNQLLKRIAEGIETSASLGVWTEQLAGLGAELVGARRAAMERLGAMAAGATRGSRPASGLTCTTLRAWTTPPTLRAGSSRNWA